MLSWKPPEQANGVLTGYEISYESMNQNGVGEKTQRPPITDPNINNAKLASLKPGTNYRIYIRATTKVGAGESYVYIFFVTKYLRYSLIVFFCI